MTKISNTGNSFDIWNLLDWSTVNNGEKSNDGYACRNGS